MEWRRNRKKCQFYNEKQDILDLMHYCKVTQDL